MIKVLITDDHLLVIEGIKALLKGHEQIEVTGHAHDGYTAIKFLKEHETDVILLDINLPDLSGIDLCIKIKEEFPHIKVLALSTFKERTYITRIIEAGASGYLLKNVNREELMEAIEMVYEGKMYLNKEIAQVITSYAKLTIPVLTTREKEVLTCIADGLTNQQTAEKLFLSPLTVDSHRKNLLTKFQVKNTASLIRFAVENKLI
jgi:DNA-binding NarL/FixJ family response regulator